MYNNLFLIAVIRDFSWCEILHKKSCCLKMEGNNSDLCMKWMYWLLCFGFVKPFPLESEKFMYYINHICVHNYVHVIVQCAQPVPLKEGASSIWPCSWQMTSGLNFKGNVEYRWTRFIQYGRICLNFCVRRKRKKPISCQTKSLDFHESSAEGRLGP